MRERAVRHRNLAERDPGGEDVLGPAPEERIVVVEIERAAGCSDAQVDKVGAPRPRRRGGPAMMLLQCGAVGHERAAAEPSLAAFQKAGESGHQSGTIAATGDDAADGRHLDLADGGEALQHLPSARP